MEIKKVKENCTWLTPRQAAEMAGCTARHIQYLITRGKLAATKEDGKYYIEKSDFFRIFPAAQKKEPASDMTHQISENERMRIEINFLRDSATQKDREIEFLRKHIEAITNEKEKMLDTILRTTRILEYKTEENYVIKNNIKKGWKRFFGF